jgi:zinc D-Ala-D-Ala dipeptidase
VTPRWDRTKGRPEPIRALNLIPELENGEPLVDIREYAPKLKIARPQVIPYVRETVAKMVHEATLKLPAHLSLGLVEGWRPIERQQRIYDFMWKSAVEAFPNRDHAGLRRTVCRWVAPTDQKAPPGHCTGAAVDVWLFDQEGNEVDVWSPLTRHQAARTFTYGIGEPHWSHRLLLHDALTSVGFSNCRDEWWHYSYGDAGWAVRMEQPTCFYGLVKLEPELYMELEKLSAEAMKERVNPFLTA